jgi:hypothetical protein
MSDEKPLEFDFSSSIVKQLQGVTGKVCDQHFGRKALGYGDRVLVAAQLEGRFFLQDGLWLRQVHSIYSRLQAGINVVECRNCQRIIS